MRASDYVNYSDDDSLSYIDVVSGSDNEDFSTTSNDSDSYEDMSDEDDNLSDASTVLNEGHQQPSQSGTDTEVELDQEVEDSEDEPIVQCKKHFFKFLYIYLTSLLHYALVTNASLLR